MRHVGALGDSESAELFRLAVDAAPNGMIVIDADGTIVLANAQMVQQFGYAKDELLGQPVEMLVPERFRSRHWPGELFVHSRVARHPASRETSATPGGRARLGQPFHKTAERVLIPSRRDRTRIIPNAFLTLGPVLAGC